MRQKQQKRFALEIKYRSEAEFNACHRRYGGSVNDMCEHLSKTINAIIMCYQGDCSQCGQYSLVCNGITGTLKSYDKSFFPGEMNIVPNDSDISILRKCLEFRLGPRGISLLKFKTNTQKVEAYNRSYSITDPKHLSRPHTFPGRIHSAAHRMNHGLATSLILKCHYVGVPLPKGCSVIRQLKSEEISQTKKSKYSKSDKYKRRRKQKRICNFAVYDDKKQDAYSSGMLDTEYTNLDYCVVECAAVRAENISRFHSYAAKMANSE